MTAYERLYNYYCKLQSKEMQSDIQGWKPIQMKGTKVAIRVDFQKDFIRVYQKQSGEVEWY